MIKFDKLDLPKLDAQDVRNEYIRYESSGQEFRYQIAEDEEFYLGNQLTKAQKDYLLSVGQPAEANNKIRPAVEQVLSNISSSSPEWDVEPVGHADNQLASIYNYIYDRIWYDSDGDSHFRKNCKDYIVKGLTYMYIYPDWEADRARGGLRIKHISPEAVFVDPNSALPDFSDASSVIYSDLHTKESLKIAFPDAAQEIDDAQEDYDGNEQSSGKYSRDDVWTRADLSDDEQVKIRKYIRWSKVSIPKIRILHKGTGSMKIFTKKQYKKFKENPKYNEFVESGQIEEQETFEIHVRETCVFGDHVYYDDILPITDYPIVPACNEHTGTPFPTGDVRHAKSAQRMLNRTEALLIAHTNATTNFKLVIEDGAIDVQELQKWNIPNAIIRANPGAIQSGKIKEFAPPAVSSQLYQEKQRFELDIEQVFGAYKYLQGQASEAPGTVGEAQIVDEAVSRKQNWKILPLYAMLTKLAKVGAEWIPFVYRQRRIIRMIGKGGMAKNVAMNDQQQDPMTGQVQKINDIMNFMCNVRVVVGSTRAKSPSAELQKNINLMGAGIYDKQEVIMRLTGDVDKEDLIKRHSEIQNLASENNSLKEKIKNLEGDLQTRERELFHTKMRAEISEATKPVAQAQANIRAAAKVEQDKQRAKTKQVTKDMDDAVKSINSPQPGAPQQDNPVA